jgi:hypothetical protein
VNGGDGGGDDGDGDGMETKVDCTIPPTNALPDPSVEICDTIGQW